MTIDNNNNNNSNISLLAPLTIYELIQKNQILETYQSYWYDSVAIKPHFNLSEIESILADAAEIVSRVRSFVDNVIKKDQMLTMRVKDGIAHDFLFHTELTLEEPEKLLKNLVFSTLKVDSTNFETGVTEELADSFIHNYLLYKKENEKEKALESYSTEKVSLLLSEIQKLTHEIFEQKSFDTQRDQKEDNFFLRSVVKALESIYLDLHRYSTSSRFVHVSDSPDSSDLSDIDDFVMVEKPDDEKPSPANLDTTTNNDNDNNDENNKVNEEDRKEGEWVVVEKESEKEEEREIKCEEVNKDDEQQKEEKKEDNQENRKIELSINNNNDDDEDNNEEKKEVAQNEEKNEDQSNDNKKESNDEEQQEQQQEQPSSEAPKIDLKSSGIIKIAKVESNIENTINEINQLRTLVNNLTIDPNDDPKISLKKVEELLRKCLFWGETLMRDLLTLDTISADKYPQSDIRPLRKKKAVQIQSLMDEIEQLKTPLKKYQSELNKAVERIEAEKQKSAPSSPASSSSSSPSPSSPSPSSPSLSDSNDNDDEEKKKKSDPNLNDKTDQSDNDNEEENNDENDLYNNLIHQWKLLKLEPQFETERQRGRYIIYASLPGMKEEDFKLQINEREGSLTISGCRLPSRDEVELLKKNLLRRYKFSSEKEFTKQLFRYGINRFGSFSSSFALPNNVISSKIEAKYDSGILYVFIPVKVAPPTTHHNPYSSRRFNNYFSPSNFYSPNSFF